MFQPRTYPRPHDERLNMDVDQVNLLLGLLTFMALAVAAVSFGAMVSGRLAHLRPYVDLLLTLAFFIALVATLGSLYYSNFEHYRPCRLCWWQRITMYPLVPVLGVGLLRRDRSAAQLYALPLAVIGLGYSIYHLRIQWFPPATSTCELDAPCTATWVDTFGFISIPFMAGSGFLAIIALLMSVVLLDRRSPSPPVDQPLSEPEEQLA